MNDKNKYYSYIISKINIRSEMKFFEYKECHDADKFDMVFVKYGKVLDIINDEGQMLLIKKDVNKYFICFPNIVKFLIEYNIVTVDILTTNKDYNFFIRVLFYSYALPLLLNMRKNTILNASTVILNNKAILFCGNSSCGKSSLAYEMVKQGAEFMCDEFSIIKSHDNKIYVEAGVPFFRIWKDTFKKTAIFEKNIELIRPELNVFAVFPKKIITKSVEIDCILYLNHGKKSIDTNIKKCIKSQKIQKLLKCMYLSEELQDIIPASQRFLTNVNICNCINIKTVEFNHKNGIQDTVKKIKNSIVENL